MARWLAQGQPKIYETSSLTKKEEGRKERDKEEKKVKKKEEEEGEKEKEERSRGGADSN